MKFNLYNSSDYFLVVIVEQDNAEVIPMHSLEKFAIAFMKSGNINLINDVVKALHRFGYRIDMV